MRVDDNDKNEDICSLFCGTCTSYPGTGEWLFCARSKSIKKIPQQVCLCLTCQVHEKYELKDEYYCMKGAAE